MKKAGRITLAFIVMIFNLFSILVIGFLKFAMKGSDKILSDNSSGGWSGETTSERDDRERWHGRGHF